MRWKIYKNELPDSVYQAALRVGAEANISHQWQLLSQRGSRRVYRYRPDAKGTGWLIKWERLTRFRNWRRALLGQNPAYLEARNAQIARDAGLPAVPCKLAAITRLGHWPIETLLVFEYVEGAKTLGEAIGEAANSTETFESILAKTASLMAEFQLAGFCHGDFSTRNVLIDEKGVLHIVDCSRLRPAQRTDPKAFRRDVLHLLKDVARAGLSKRDVGLFLRTYVERLGVKPSERRQWIEDALNRARLRRIKNSRRAYQHCTKKSHLFERFFSRGYTVFLLRGRSRAKVEDSLRMLNEGKLKPAANRELILHRGRRGKKTDSDLLHCWRMANALERCGLQAHCAVAYGRRRWPFREEFLLCTEPADKARVGGVLARKEMRKPTLAAAGRFMRRLHDAKLTVARYDPEEWGVAVSKTGTPYFITTDFRAYDLFEDEDFDTQFQWLIDWLACHPDAGLKAKDLVVFLRAYGDGHVDRTLWQQITTVADSSSEKRTPPPGSVVG